MYEVIEPNLYRDPKTTKLVDLDGDEVQRQLRISPKGSSISLSPLASVPSIESTLENRPATNSPTLIERTGDDYANVTDSSYVVLLLYWCSTYLFALCGDSEAQPRKSVPAIEKPPTPPPSLPSLPTPHVAIPRLGPSVPAVVVGFKRKFVDDNNPPACSINPARRAPHFPCVLHLIVLHIKH